MIDKIFSNKNAPIQIQKIRKHNLLKMFEEEEASYIPAKQGGQTLVDKNQFTYSVMKRRDTLVSYYCRGRKTLGCPVIAKVDPRSSMIIDISGAHIHDSDLQKTRVKQQENTAILAAALNPSVAPRTVLGSITADVINASSEAVGSMRKNTTLVKAIQRARTSKFGFPPVPGTWEAMDIPDCMKVTKYGRRFLLKECQLKEDEPEKVIILSSDKQMEVLNNSEDWMGDGTFDIASKTMFSQVGITVDILI